MLCVCSQLEEPFDMAIYKRRRSGARSRHRTEGIFGGKPCTMTLSYVVIHSQNHCYHLLWQVRVKIMIAARILWDRHNRLKFFSTWSSCELRSVNANLDRANCSQQKNQEIFSCIQSKSHCGLSGLHCSFHNVTSVSCGSTWKRVSNLAFQPLFVLHTLSEDCFQKWWLYLSI